MTATVKDKIAERRASLAERRTNAFRNFENLREKEIAAAAPVVSRDAALQAMLSRIKIQSGVIYGEVSEQAAVQAGLPHSIRKNHELT